MNAAPSAAKKTAPKPETKTDDAPQADKPAIVFVEEVATERKVINEFTDAVNGLVVDSPKGIGFDAPASDTGVPSRLRAAGRARNVTLKIRVNETAPGKLHYFVRAVPFVPKPRKPATEDAKPEDTK